MLNSLQGRLMILSLVALVALMTGMGLLLERSYYVGQLNALKERLTLHSYTLLSVSEFMNQQLHMPDHLPDERFNQVGSDIAAYFMTPDYQYAWLSGSAPASFKSTSYWAKPGQWHYSMVSNQTTDYLLGRFGVSWADAASGQVKDYNLLLLLDLSAFQQERQQYDQTLVLMLVVLSSIILILQWWVLRWGLQPLRAVSEELARLQSGKQAELNRDYPRELRPLTSNLNLLIKSERTQRERYRNTLADVSHSLKTPLAVINGLLDQPQTSTQLDTEIRQQTDKMNTIIGYHLQRSVAGTAKLAADRVELLPIVQSLSDAMTKVYRDKAYQGEGSEGKEPQNSALDIQLDINPDIRWRGDSHDLMEVLGNLMDNACKYGHGRVRVSASHQSKGLRIQVEDNGQGIAPDQQTRILQRGQRLDTLQAGQGLGLAVVVDILDGYGATLSIDRSVWGGACFTLQFVDGAADDVRAETSLMKSDKKE